ncbi:hypothetical protein [Nocardiopsis deserti]|uniref:hypothetical protein n=1 Tax=Nocardiopsis deserti TaxID=2605988 RepID=UPI00123B7707|nr:hypothetical protein [Nocardiopsis deserti]
MRNGIGTTRLSTIAVLLGALVLMSLACSLVNSADASAPAASAAPQSAVYATSASDTAESGSGEAQESHPCGVPQSQPSAASGPLLGALTVLPLLELFGPPTTDTSPNPVTEVLPVRHGDGLLTFLCVQRV